eukprot:jgi/Ulvmu1/5489/UM023_0025.1
MIVQRSLQSSRGNGSSKYILCDAVNSHGLSAGRGSARRHLRPKSRYTLERFHSGIEASRMEDGVSHNMLMYVADFLVDELSQNPAVASATKERMRSYVDNLSAFMAGTRHNGNGEQKNKGIKRKDATRLDSDTPEMRAQTPAEKKPRQRSMHHVFVSYGSHCLPRSMAEHREKRLPGTNHMELLNRYSRSLPKQQLQIFEDEYKHFLDEFNDEPIRKKGDMKALALRLKQHDQEKGVDVHPVFNDFMAFIDKEAESREGKVPPKGRKSIEPAAAAADKKKKPAAAAAASAVNPEPATKPAPATKAKPGKAAPAKAPAKLASQPQAEESSDEDDDDDEDGSGSEESDEETSE